MAKKTAKKSAKKSVAKTASKKPALKKAKAKAKVTSKRAVVKKTVKRAAAVKRTSAQKQSSLKAEEAGMSAIVGSKVSPLVCAATGQKNLSLKDFEGRRVVLYFYPKDNTPGCTLESQDFSRLVDQFSRCNAVVLGVSKDAMKSHESFKAKFQLNFDLLSDQDESLCRAFQVIQKKKLYGREFMGIERSTFVISEDGLVLREWRKVKVDGHAEEVLDFLKTLD
jgi:peroxiredoxin Q/BCP